MTGFGCYMWARGERFQGMLRLDCPQGGILRGADGCVWEVEYDGSSPIMDRPRHVSVRQLTTGAAVAAVAADAAMPPPPVTASLSSPGASTAYAVPLNPLAASAHAAQALGAPHEAEQQGGAAAQGARSPQQVALLLDKHKATPASLVTNHGGSDLIFPLSQRSLVTRLHINGFHFQVSFWSSSVCDRVPSRGGCEDIIGVGVKTVLTR